MSVQALREFVSRQAAAATGLAALAAALDAKASGTPLAPSLEARVQALLTALGVGEALSAVSGDEGRPILNELRTMLSLDAKLLQAQTRTTTWNHTDEAILDGAGAMSAGFITPLAQVLLPGLEGIVDRLSAPGGRFLDVGVGVAGLAIAAARRWPSLQIVGIDPWQPSLSRARENVAKAQLADRIELREQRAEDLTDDRAFDLAWVPGVFMPSAALGPACERVHRALRPGGWMLFNAVQPTGDPMTDAMWWLRLSLFGDSALPMAEAEQLLRDLGYTDVQTLCSPAGSFMRIVAGRRGPDR